MPHELAKPRKHSTFSVCSYIPRGTCKSRHTNTVRTVWMLYRVCKWMRSENRQFVSREQDVAGHGKLGHAQTCPPRQPMCINGYDASMSLVLANLTALNTSLVVRSIALATLSPALVTVQVRATAIWRFSALLFTALV
jgi:hypothetical protein